MTGAGIPAMAWRNLWRNRRRTLITLSSIGFGILLAVLFTGMGDHSYAKMIDLAARMGGGHVTIQHREYLDIPALTRTVADTAAARDIARADTAVTRVVTRISGPAMLATARASAGTFMLGIDPREENEDTLAGFGAIVEGELFAAPDDKGIILGKTLAENLEVELGKKVVYTMTDKHGEVVSGLARVRGIVETGSGLDSALCWLPIDTVRDTLGYGTQEATLVAIFTGDERVSTAVAARIAAQLPKDAAAVTWRQTQPELAGFITMDRAGAVFFEIIILILVAAGIFNSLFVSVMERIREFGIMMAIGFTPWRLFALVMWECVWLGLAGLVAAAAITIGPYMYLHENGLDMTEMMGGEQTDIAGVAFDAVIYPTIYPEHLLYICAIVVVATLLAGIYPAIKAGRVVPAETIRLV